MRAYLSSLAPRLSRDVYVLQAGGLLNAFGNGVVLPFLVIYLHNVRGISLGVAGLAIATQSISGLASAFVGGTLSDRVGPKRVLVGALCVMTVAFGLMPLIRHPWHAFALYVLWGAGSGSFWPAQSSLLAALTPAERHEFIALASKLEPRAFAVAAADHVSPFPLPKKMLSGRGSRRSSSRSR